MAIDYSVFDNLPGAIGKGVTAGRHREKVKSDRQTRDEKENAKVRNRSGGICEVTIAGVRCKRRAGGWGGVHHHYGGNGRRGRGDSALAKHKTDTCPKCHAEITANRLLHLRGNHYKPAKKEA